MANITDLTLDRCPACGSETILRMKVDGYQYLTGEWDGDIFLIHDSETDTDDGPYEVTCDSIKCGWVGGPELVFTAEWA